MAKPCLIRDCTADAASQASVAAQQAADQQQQINNMNAIMPVPQQ